MRIGSVIGRKKDGSYKAIEQGTDIEGMKRRLKEEKLNEEKSEFDAMYLFINASKRVRLKNDDSISDESKKATGTRKNK